MAFDFRASQIRTNKIIATGSTNTGASILLYGYDADGEPPLAGNLGTSFDTTSIGPDTFFYVSGSEEKRMVVGGGITLSGTVVPLQGLPIGDAPAANFVEGLFDGWSGTTTIGTAIREINNVLKALAPTRPPNLSSLSANSAGATGKLIVDVSYPFTTHSPIPSRFVDESYGFSGDNLGIFVSGSSFSGYLANSVATGPGTPYSAYDAKALNRGNEGFLELYLNDVLLRSIDLSIETATVDAGTGFNLSEAKSVLFSTTGIPFDGFKYRTAAWTIQAPIQTLGRNTVKVIHNISIATQYITNQLEWFVDGGGTPIAFSDEQITDLSLTGTKYLSGVNYYTGGTFNYSITGSNVYSGAAYSGNPVSFTTNYGLQSVTSEYLPAVAGNHSSPVNIYKTVSFQTSGIRLIAGSVSVRTTIPVVIGSSAQSSGASVSNVLMDNVSNTCSETNETFTSEQYRLPSNVDSDDKTLATDLWDSSISITSISIAGYLDGLLVGESKLMIPAANYGGILHGPASNVNYSADIGIGDRTYYRMFIGDAASANFVLRLNGSSATIVAAANLFSSANQMKVEIKAPTQTGWLCAYNDFISGEYGDGGGARAASFGVGKALNVNWGLTVGIKNIVNSNYRIYLRITVPYNFSGYLSNMSLSFM